MTTTPTEAPATIINLAGTVVSGSARFDLSSNAWQMVSFTDSDISAHATKTVSSTGAVSAIASSLVSSLAITVKVLGISVPLSPLIALVKPVLTAAASLLDPVVQSLLDMLGIHLGQADIRINGVRCGTASLIA
jgi:uncharacterized membrane protein